ncbi:DUF427 domain-containing protein [Neptunicoccus sediminis]|uniref:DUF427 domain-containing protein n=1 Tax=Neptunicoccus sediminis TaxID=1892596 RepID=UPI000845E214|nr:DUF427 domain-containing protein [Neptunicoccus sediminis]
MGTEPEIVIEPAPGKWSIRAQGAVIGNTARALLLRENGREPVLYVPRDDLQMVFFDPSDDTTHCPHKGDATYYHLVGKNRRDENVAWSYESPLDSVSEIAGHLAFDKDTITIDQVS